MNEKYQFQEPLRRGTILKRLTQFTMLVDVDGVETRCHCPSSTRVGDFDNAGLPCLYSISSDPKRKLPITVEAISCNGGEKWVGINMTRSNRIVEHFLRTHQLNEMISDYEDQDVKREQWLGMSKLDFLVKDTYLEVKTPCMSIDVEYGPDIKVQKQAPLHDIDRMLKHSTTLADSLESHQRAIFLQVHQYIPDDIQRPHPMVRHIDDVIRTFLYALEHGVEWWTLDCDFQPDGVSFHRVRNTSRQNIEELREEVED